MKLRTQILLFFLIFALTPLITAVVLNLPLVLERMELFYHKAHLLNLRADFKDLDQHLASRDEMVRLLAKLPEPGNLLGEDELHQQDKVDIARARYTQWINQILQDQLDIIEIIFFDQNGQQRFWLDRDKTSQEWRPTIEHPTRPNLDFLKTALLGETGSVLVSPISFDPEAGSEDPRRFMTLRLISVISDRTGNAPLGAIMMIIDVGGIARHYNNTLWVHNDGSFMDQAGPIAPRGDAFSKFPGLQAIFTTGKLDLWEHKGQRIIWIPLFRTEQSGPLWVGRRVDPSPIAQFRNALTLRVLSIVFALATAIWFASHWFAKRADRLSHKLIDGVEQVLKGEEGVTFNWRGPQEVRKLGENLSQLAEEHGRTTHNLRAHARKLEESNRYKSQFLANVSHELRTPLNSILLLSKLLAEKDGGLTQDQAKKARVIHEAGSDLQALIDNILDLSRIEAQSINLNLEPIDLPAMLKGLIELVHPQFDVKGLELQLVIEDDAPRQIKNDPDKLRQIIKNFLSNSVKFTHTGAVILKLAAVAEDDTHSCGLCISVSDSGIGIPPSKQKHIFNAFQQADGSTNRRYGGTGLGLTISQELALLLGGRIELTSIEGQGSTFSLLLPIDFDHACAASNHPCEINTRDNQDTEEEPSVPPSPEIDQERDTLFSGHRVLLVDDDVHTLLSLTPLLESWSLELTAAGDGTEALEVLEDDDEFSIVLMDIMMPGMDGYDTIRTIRTHERFKGLPIIALTARTENFDRETCLEAGANDFVIKPVDPKKLKEVIVRHLPKPS
ncbi:MAG: response regulator [Gammaproteobacteria bacterium]|nr:response regulator [Gammaproteobacteria bacterium]